MCAYVRWREMISGVSSETPAPPSFFLYHIYTRLRGVSDAYDSLSVLIERFGKQLMVNQ